MERNSTIAAWRIPGAINSAANKGVSAMILSYHDSVPPTFAERFRLRASQGNECQGNEFMERERKPQTCRDGARARRVRKSSEKRLAHPTRGPLPMNLLGAPASRWRVALHWKHQLAGETPALPGRPSGSWSQRRPPLTHSRSVRCQVSGDSLIHPWSLVGVCGLWSVVGGP